MVAGKIASRWGVGVAVSLTLAGCVTLGDISPSPQASAVQARTRPTPPAAGPDLRIADNAVAQASDIPLVPVPPPPLNRDNRPAVPPARPAAPVAPAAAVAPPAAAPALTVRQVYQQARDRYATIDSYIVRLVRREQVKGKNQPEEIILFKFRKEPWSLSFKWLGEVGKDREVIYVKGHYEDKIHTKLAAGDAPFMPAGKVLSLPVDSILVRNASRHPITDAGVGVIIEHLGRTLDANERGDRRHGVLSSLGVVTRPEFSQQRLLGIQNVLPPGADPELPRGGRRFTFFDPESHLPVLVTTRDDRGQEVEYYRYDRLLTPVKLDDNDFNPTNLAASATGR